MTISFQHRNNSLTASIGLNRTLHRIAQNIQTLIAITGIIGNIFVILVFSRRRLKSTSCAFFYRFKAILHICLLIHSFRHWIRTFFHLKIEEFSWTLCKLDEFLAYSMGLASIWLMTVILLDRLVTLVYQKLSSPILKQLSHRFLLIGFILIYGFGMHSSFVFDYQYEKTSSTLTINNNSSSPRFICYLPTRSLKINMIIAIGNILANSIVNTILYVKLIRYIFERRRRIRTRSNMLLKKDLKCAIGSVAITVFNLASKMTFAVILLIVSSMTNVREDELHGLFTVCVSFAILGNSMTFFINLIFNSIFYTEFTKMIRLFG